MIDILNHLELNLENNIVKKYGEILDIAKNIEHNDVFDTPFCIRSYPTITKSLYEKIDGIKIFIPNSNRFLKIYGILQQDSLGLSKEDIPFREKYSKVLERLNHLDKLIVLNLDISKNVIERFYFK